MSGPKILIYDIETAPLVGFAWGLWENNIALNQLLEDWSVLCWAAKWYGEDHTYYDDVRDNEDIRDDSDVVASIHEMIDEADIVVTHNGKRFDEKKLNARFFKWGLPPLGKKRHIDTKQLASSKFGFTSNKLEYLTSNFTEAKKSQHAKFPGFTLWRECLAGNPEAWDEMVDYNIQDVLSLEDLFEKMLPWENSINLGIYEDERSTMCGHSTLSLQKRGFQYTNTGKFQRYQCSECGKWSVSRKNLIEKKQRKKLTKGG